MGIIIKQIILGLAIIIFIIVFLGTYKFNYLAAKPGYDCDGNKIKMPADVIEFNNEDHRCTIKPYNSPKFLKIFSPTV